MKLRAQNRIIKLSYETYERKCINNQHDFFKLLNMIF